MPCKLCHRAFKIVPCEHPTGVFDYRLYKDTYSLRYDHMKKIYRILSQKNRCPCRNCLVHPICIEWCPMYEEWRDLGMWATQNDSKQRV